MSGFPLVQKMKCGFIRAVWGVYDDSHRITRRRSRIDNDIDTILSCQYSEPFVTYVMGKDNFNRMMDRGVKNCVLLTDDPAPFDLVKHQYRHKMEIIRHAMEVDGYNELVYLDWDCVPQKPLPDNFWDELKKKDVFQATLQIYRRKKCHWRLEEQRKVPNGGFIYLRDKSLPAEAIRWWEKLGKPDNDEPAWARLTDEMMGGWDIEEYWNRFEIMFCNLHRSSPYSKEKMKQKNVCFIHYQG